MTVTGSVHGIAEYDRPLFTFFSIFIFLQKKKKKKKFLFSDRGSFENVKHGWKRTLAGPAFAVLPLWPPLSLAISSIQAPMAQALSTHLLTSIKRFFRIART